MRKEKTLNTNLQQKVESYFKTKGKKIKYWWCLGAKRKLDNYFLIWYLHFND